MYLCTHVLSPPFPEYKLTKKFSGFYAIYSTGTFILFLFMGMSGNQRLYFSLTFVLTILVVHIETNHVVCVANQLTDFHII